MHYLTVCHVGFPPTPGNLSFYTNYSIVDDFQVAVNLKWSSTTLSLEEGSRYEDLYLININDNGSTIVTEYTSNMSLTVMLQVNKTYSVTLQASRCNQSLTSDPYITNFTIIGKAIMLNTLFPLSSLSLNLY